MSFSKSKSKQQSQQTSQAQSYLDPDVKGALLQNYSDLTGHLPQYTPYTGEKVAGFTPQQTNAFSAIDNIAKNNTGLPALQAGQGAAAGVAGFQAPTVGAQNAAGIDLSSIPMVGTMKDLSDQIAGYMRQGGSYVNDVVNATANDLNMQRLRELVGNASDLTKAGAWRGNANAVADSLTNESSDRTLASTIANLRSAGYGQAATLAGQDAARALQASQGNQGAVLSALGTNAQVGVGNADRSLTGQQANQNAAIQAAQQRLGAAGVLGNLSNEELTQAQSRAGGELAAGNQQQANNQSILDWLYQNNYLNPQQWQFAVQALKNQTLGLAGDPTLSTSTSQGTSTGSSSGFGFSTGKG